MIPQPFFYQLVVLGLLGLFVMLHDAWPSRCVASPHKPSKPLPPPRKRSSDPKPFPGLTRKPPCAACAQAHAHGPQPPGCPPPRMAPTRGRPRQVDTSHHFCPDPDCTYGGWLGLGNITSNGHPSGGPWRQLHCTGCGGYFQETHGTPLHGKRVVPERLVWAVGALAEGLGIRAVVQVLAPGCMPLLLTDGVQEYMTALLTHYGQWVQPARQHAQGPAPKPRWMPLPGLRYAQVVKTVRRRRLVGVTHRVVFGSLEAVNHVLAPLGWHINTAFVERINLTIRQHVAAVGRRVSTLCKGEDGLRQQLALYQVYYNFCLPHASVRQPLPQPEPTNGTGSAKLWRPYTPAMAAGLTDHVWTLREVLLFRLPSWPPPAGV